MAPHTAAAALLRSATLLSQHARKPLARQRQSGSSPPCRGSIASEMSSSCRTARQVGTQGHPARRGQVLRHRDEVGLVAGASGQRVPRMRGLASGADLDRDALARAMTRWPVRIAADRIARGMTQARRTSTRILILSPAPSSARRAHVFSSAAAATLRSSPPVRSTRLATRAGVARCLPN